MNNHYMRVQDDMKGQPLTKVIEAGTEAMQRGIEEYMRMMGSANKA
jgi:fructose-bisphosphate aldolase class II